MNVLGWFVDQIGWPIKQTGKAISGVLGSYDNVKPYPSEDNTWHLVIVVAVLAVTLLF